MDVFLSYRYVIANLLGLRRATLLCIRTNGVYRLPSHTLSVLAAVFIKAFIFNGDDRVIHVVGNLIEFYRSAVFGIEGRDLLAVLVLNDRRSRHGLFV